MLLLFLSLSVGFADPLPDYLRPAKQSMAFSLTGEDHMTVDLTPLTHIAVFSVGIRK